MLLEVALSGIAPHMCPSGAPAKVVVPRYSDVIMGAIASQITSLTIVYSAVYSSAYQRKHQSSASLAFVSFLMTSVCFPYACTTENEEVF